jgi:carbonic anhydrase/acetyltransferase-like protein (isoleucine patch superfamily)
MMYRLGDAAPVLDGGGHFVAPDASLIGKVRLAAGASVWFGAVLRGDNDWIEIGANSNIQDGAILHTDPGLKLTVGAGVTVGHRVMLHGCTIGDGSLIGIGSTILNNAVIGKRCLVGAHSLVTEGKQFPDGVLIVGSPARVVRTLSDDDQALLAKSAAIYTQNSQRYQDELAALEHAGNQ